MSSEVVVTLTIMLLGYLVPALALGGAILRAVGNEAARPLHRIQQQVRCQALPPRLIAIAARGARARRIRERRLAAGSAVL